MMKRAVDLTGGRAFVVTDLHGQWEPYSRYRDRFLTLYEAEEADYLIFLGDVIHGYGRPEEDYSLHILLDIMALQEELGTDRVLMLLGNHELPHIYGITLTKGDLEFTSRFEHALGEDRGRVIDFLRSAPFMVRTSGGVMLLHAGADADLLSEEAVNFILNLSHSALWEEAERLLQKDDVIDLVAESLGLTVSDYDRLAWERLAVSGPEDPRYYDLIKGIIVGNLEPEWSWLWNFFFTQCEAGLQPAGYSMVVDDFLSAFSGAIRQQVMVTGHISVKDGYAVVDDRHLRLASWAHSRPKEAGKYLLLDVDRKVQSAQDLLADLYPISH